MSNHLQRYGAKRAEVAARRPSPPPRTHPLTITPAPVARRTRAHNSRSIVWFGFDQFLAICDKHTAGLHLATPEKSCCHIG
jgi:hypothetical protein